MPDFIIQLTGLLVLVLPLMAVQWNMAGRSRRRQRRLVAPKEQQRWRLEIYSNQDGAEDSIVDRADIPFPVKQVRSAKGELARKDGGKAWALPQLELEVVVDDPFTDDVLSGLFGVEHHVRFVTGNEAVLDARGDKRVRIRALPFR
ncbi:MAG: hypothetical protein ACR2QK_16420 [Acidimicrobiales bacterium]